MDVLLVFLVVILGLIGSAVLWSFSFTEIPIWIVFSYLAGSIPFSFLTAKAFKGIDIRKLGSGNPGAANVYRTAGPAAGIAAFLLDFLKGFLPVFLAARYFGPDRTVLWIIVAICAIAGHMWTVFLNFRGGKGVATSAGVFFAVLPLPAAGAFALFWAVVLLTKHASTGSITAAIALPVFSLLLGRPKSLTIFAACMAVLIIFQHRSNIKRLIEGKELKIRTKTTHTV
ncbi:MAG: glycerol-3-phosphate 1-O-acyltransferase PlsY [Elusimicrobiota bacterium]